MLDITQVQSPILKAIESPVAGKLKHLTLKPLLKRVDELALLASS
jgi:hypothetical protein